MPALATGDSTDFTIGGVHRYVLTLKDVTGPNPADELWMYVDNETDADLHGASTFVPTSLTDGNGTQFVFGAENGGFNAFAGRILRVRISDNIVNPADFIAVPEPGSLGLIALGSTLLLRRSRR